MKKKLSAIFLALCMVLSLMPTALADSTALAGIKSEGNTLTASGESSDFKTYTGPPASITSTTATELPTAGENDVITLTQNVTLTSTYEVTSDTTIDLAGFTITGQDVRAIHVKKGTLTLTGTGMITSVKSEGGSFAQTSSVIRVGSDETTAAGLVVGDGVTISAPNSYGVTVFGAAENNSLTVYGKITSAVSSAVGGNGTSTWGATSITVNDGAELNSDSDYAIYHPQKGTLTINGGTITGKGGIEAKSGSTTIAVNGNPTITATAETATHNKNSDGTSTTGYAIAVVENADYAGGANVTIGSGTITGKIDILKDDTVESGKEGRITIGGGTFNDPNVLNYLGSHATINLKLAADCNSSLTIPEDSTVNLDLNDKNITASTGHAIMNKGILTVTGNGKVSATATDDQNGAAINNSGKLTLKGGTYENNVWYVVENSGNITIDGAVTIQKATSATNTASIIHNNGTRGKVAELTIKSGNFNGKSGEKSCAVVMNDDYGKLTINGGDFDSTASANKGYDNTTILNWGVATITGGTFTGKYPISNGKYLDETGLGVMTISGGTFNGSDSMFGLGVNNGQNPTTSYYAEDGVLTITGGTFNATALTKNYTSNTNLKFYSISITGGTFSTNPSDYVASGYYVATNGDGATAPITYTVYQRTYSSGSSSSSSNTTSSTVKNPDGSSTTTTTNKTTGVTTEVTKNTDGSVDTVITNKDGSTTESTKTSGGTTATVETNKNGDTTSVSASVSSTDAKSANKSGGSVTLPLTGVTPAASSEEAQTIDIDVPSNVSSVTVEIPVEDVTPGTVVIIVNKDGTETIVPTSTVTENGIEVTLTEDATIKIVDNSKTFNDVPESNVFHDEIAAMSARGIMVGKTDDTFDVYGDVTLNQIVNVAGRVSGAVATEDYEGGVAWGEANGLATGDTPATRGQVILALYVAAGSPDAMDTGKLSAYSDGASVPSELLSAVLWAVENGILKGTDAGTLDLGSNVTRGQAAAFAGRTLGVIG